MRRRGGLLLKLESFDGLRTPTVGSARKDSRQGQSHPGGLRAASQGLPALERGSIVLPVAGIGRFGERAAPQDAGIGGRQKRAAGLRSNRAQRRQQYDVGLSAVKGEMADQHRPRLAVAPRRVLFHEKPIETAGSQVLDGSG